MYVWVNFFLMKRYHSIIFSVAINSIFWKCNLGHTFKLNTSFKEVLCSTYVIGHYNPSVRIINLVSHTTYVVGCVNFIHKWQDLQFKVDSERQIFWETFNGNFIYSLSFCQKSAERESPKKYFFVFCFDVWPGTRTLALRLISQHTTY